MDGPRDYHIVWNKSDRKRQISYIAFIWNLKKKIIQMKGNGQRYSIQTEMTKQGLQFSYHTKWTLKQDYKDKEGH